MTSTPASEVLFEEALGFLIEHNGYLGDQWKDDPFGTASWKILDKRIKALGLSIKREEALSYVGRAIKAMEMSPRSIYICRGPNCKNLSPPVERNSVAHLPTQTTGCQGTCDFSPRAALRFDGSQRDFRNLDANNWKDLLSLGANAFRAGTLLVENDPTRDLQFDPRHPEPSPNLRNLEFLLGHFRGEGHYGETNRLFSKEVVGNWVAGGSALALKMQVSYPLASGGVDSHQALVIMGHQRNTDEYIGHAWTDSGGSLEYRYRIDRESGAVVFSDQSPEHDKTDQKAKKTLVPKDQGYEEQLEICDDSGRVSIYSSVLLKRAGSPTIGI